MVDSTHDTVRLNPAYELKLHTLSSCVEVFLYAEGNILVWSSKEVDLGFQFKLPPRLPARLAPYRNLFDRLHICDIPRFKHGRLELASNVLTHEDIQLLQASFKSVKAYAKKNVVFVTCDINA